MSQFNLEPRCVALLAAQVNLNGTFNHISRDSSTRHRVEFTLQVDRGNPHSVFNVTLGNQRHSLALPNGRRNTHLRLATFIEDIANGRMDGGGETVDETPSSAPACTLLSDEQRCRIKHILARGGVVELNIGLGVRIHVAAHRSPTEPRITAILSVGVNRPYTRCVSLHGTPAQALEQLIEAIALVAKAATPSAAA